MRVYLVGATGPAGDRVAAELATKLGIVPLRQWPEAVQAGDCVILDAAAHDASVPGGNAFTACRTLKQDTRVLVWLLMAPGDRYAAEIGRFCLADGNLTLGADGRLQGLEALHERLVASFRPSVDDLLARREEHLDVDAERHESVLQRMLSEQQQWVIEHLTDPDTGLFAASFAAFKLDEEFKRAIRFHQPLSAVLLDLGAEAQLPADPARRRMLLAEVAAVLLNECRDIDVLARFSPTTFLLLLPGTGTDGAARLARRLLQRLTAGGVAGQKLAASAGVATVPATGVDRRDQFVARAEDCLQQARDGHGDRGLCIAGA
jgi:diguanylate cyclase (GGDEF)-like protein